MGINFHKQKATAAKIRQAEQESVAIALRKSGKTFQEIGNALRLSKTRAYYIVVNALGRLRSQIKIDAAEYLERDWEATEALLETWLPQALQGKENATTMVLKILGRRAKYRGLDAPAKSQMHVTGDVQHHPPREEMLAQIQKALAVKHERTCQPQHN